MILALSRFKVRNGLEAQVRFAFLNRPHLLDAVPGFLGLETFTDAADGSLFYLVTRWTDQASFQTWHRSEAHHRSHTGIPKGLKLDAAFTQVVIMDRITDPNGLEMMDELAADTAPVLAQYLAQTLAVHVVTADRDGTIRTCNHAVCSRLKQPAEALIGRPLWSVLMGTDAAMLRQRVAAAARRPIDNILLNFVDADTYPYTLECRLDVQPDRFTLIGESPVKQEQSATEQLVQVNNELAVLARENTRKNRAPARANAQLEIEIGERRRVAAVLRSETRRLSTIVRMQQAVAMAGLDLEAVMTIIVEDALGLTGADGAAVMQAEGQDFICSASRGVAAPGLRTHLGINEGLFRWCVQTGTTLHCDDAETDGRVARETAQARGIFSMIIAPLLHSGEVVGVLEVLSRSRNVFSAQDTQSLQLAAGLLAATMRQASEFAAKQRLLKENMQALQALQAGEQQFRNLVENAPIGACILTRDGTFETVNDAFAALFGYARGELVGAHVSLVIPTHDRDQPDEGFGRRLAAGVEDLPEYAAITRQGRALSVLALTVEIITGDGPGRYASFVIDNTERHRAANKLAFQAEHDPLTGLPNRALRCYPSRNTANRKDSTTGRRTPTSRRDNGQGRCAGSSLRRRRGGFSNDSVPSENTSVLADLAARAVTTAPSYTRASRPGAM